MITRDIWFIIGVLSFIYAAIQFIGSVFLYSEEYEWSTAFEYLREYSKMNMFGIIVCSLLIFIMFMPLEIGIWIYRFFYWIFHIGT